MMKTFQNGTLSNRTRPLKLRQPERRKKSLFSCAYLREEILAENGKHAQQIFHKTSYRKHKINNEKLFGFSFIKYSSLGSFSSCQREKNSSTEVRRAAAPRAMRALKFTFMNLWCFIRAELSLAALAQKLAHTKQRLKLETLKLATFVAAQQSNTRFQIDISVIKMNAKHCSREKSLLRRSRR